MVYIPEWNNFFYDWIEKHPLCNISIISRETASLVSRILSHDRKALSTSRIVQTLKGLENVLKIRNISVINIDQEQFYLTPAIMPDDYFHHSFAEKFYGKKFIHLVEFEEISARFGLGFEAKLKVQTQNIVSIR